MIIVNSYKFDGFEITIVTTTSPQTFVLPIASGGTYGGVINWGDGTTTTITAAGNYSKVYATAGTYKIKIKGAFHGINFNNTGTSKNLVTRVKISPTTRSLRNAFFGCSNLAIVTGTIPSSVTDIGSAWAYNQLTSWTIAIPSSVTDIVFAWAYNRLTSWTVAIPSGVTNIAYAWAYNQLTSWNVAIPSGVFSLHNTWRNNQLTSWTIAIPSGVQDFNSTWLNNTTLVNFAANIFDGCLGREFAQAFTNTGLNQQSIDNILVSINSNNTSNGRFNQSGGSAPSVTGQSAITAMRSRGWTITVTGGF